MSDFKHTRGPWIVSRTSGMEIFINHEHDRADRVPGYFAEVRRFTTDHSQVEANAKLIAAAPELLEALLDCREALRRTGHDGELAIVNAAIAKATGGTL